MAKAITDIELTAVIGEELFKKCLEKFYGRQYYFKKKSNPLQFKNQREKEEFIHDAFLNGLSFEEIGVKLQITPEYARKVFYKQLHQKKNS